MSTLCGGWKLGFDHAAPRNTWENERVPRNMPPASVTSLTSHVETSQVNEVAPSNICHMHFTLPTSHEEISQLNCRASRNMFSMVTTPDTSHHDKSSSRG